MYNIDEDEELIAIVTDFRSEDWDKVECVSCEAPFPLLGAIFDGENPICPHCGKNQGDSQYD